MADDPSPDRPRPSGDIPMAGPASRVFRYLPQGDPEDRAQRYLAEHDPVERAQRYLGAPESTVRPAPAPAPAQPPPASQAGPAVAPRRVASIGVEGPADRPPPHADSRPGSALHDMVAAVLEERRAPVAEPGIVAPEPARPPDPPSAPADLVAAPVPPPDAEPVELEPAAPEPPEPAEPEPSADRTPEPAPVAEPAQPTAEWMEPEPPPPAEWTPPEPEPPFVEWTPPAPEPEAVVEPTPSPEAPAVSALAALRELADRLRTAEPTPDAFQPALDRIREAVAADEVVLQLSVPRPEHVASGSAATGGPHRAAPVRCETTTAGELAAARAPGAPDFEPADELFLSLAADVIGGVAARGSAGAALAADEQRFVNVLVAEMRAPLATVAGLLGDFTDGNAGTLTGAQLGYLGVAADHTGRLLAIVRDLQTLSALRRPEPHEVDHVAVGPMLARVVAARRAQAQAHGVDLVVEEPTEALVVRGVPEQLDRALSAVVDNAIRFSHDGGRAVLSAARAGSEVEVTVADDGIGMDPTEAQDAFARFFRARTAVDAGIPGVGLGLNIAKEVVEVHGGRVWAESAPGQGTRVHLALPAA